MNTWLTFIVFICVLFLYVHITAQWKKSEDLEVYEMDFENNKQLQNMCESRQPLLFYLDEHCPHLFNRLHLAKLSPFGTDTVNIKDSIDYWNEDAVDSVSLEFRSSEGLTSNDKYSRYWSEGNSGFLQETGMSEIFETADSSLKPAFNVNTTYDFMFGSSFAATPLRYHSHHRYYLAVTSGKITVKMTPWRSSRHLHPIKDYEHYEFRSAINIWNPQKHFMGDLEKVHFIDVEVHEGQVLYIPAWWWYSIRFSTDPTTCVATFTYNTIADIASNAKEWGLYYLQQSNIKEKVAKTISPENNSMTNENVRGKDRDTQSLKELLAEVDRTTGEEEVVNHPKEKREIVTNAGIY